MALLRTQLEGIASAWWRGFQRPVVSWVVLPAAFTVLIRLAMVLLGFSSQGWPTEAGLFVAVTVASAGFFEFAQLIRTPRTQVLDALLHAGIQEVTAFVDAADRGDSIELPQAAAEGRLRELFWVSGASSTEFVWLTPSAYSDIYGGWLNVHGEQLRRRPTSGSRRVLITTAAELVRDYSEDAGRYRTFIEWHRRYGVGLYWIDVSMVDVEGWLQRTWGNINRIEAWRDYAVVSGEGDSGRAKLVLIFGNDSRLLRLMTLLADALMSASLVPARPRSFQA
jgi:hypothetical protein